MPDFTALTDAAYHAERVLARRLATRNGISEQQALRLTLERSAGADGLYALLQQRRQQRDIDSARRQAKVQAKADQLAAKRAGPPLPADAWRGWFDGSAHPNPGKIGIGAVLLAPDGTTLEISRRLGHGNSGEAEYGALIALLEAAVAAGARELVLYGDSRVVIDDVNAMAPRGAAGLESLRARASGLLELLGRRHVRLCWIPRHKNGAADALSQRAAALHCASDD